MKKTTAPIVLHNDKDLIVLVKPSGMLSESDPFGNPSVQGFVAGLCGREIKIKTGPGMVHRLDRSTGGVMVLAKKASILKQLNSDFENRLVKKTYLAEVEGSPVPSSARLSHFLTKNNRHRKAILHHKAVKGSAQAILSYETIENRGRTSILRIHLETGRYHQIRAQLAFIGHPVLGDDKYGSTIPSVKIHLHACGLEFTHPKTGKRLVFASNPYFYPGKISG